MYNHVHHRRPCLHCQPHTYIRMVHHMIERCLLLRMTRDDCIQALAKHASVQPCVTLTIWRELHKENRNYFQAYFRYLEPRHHVSSFYKPNHMRTFKFGRRHAGTEDKAGDR